MKSLIHKIVHMLWRLTAPLRRPLVSRLQQRMTAATLQAMQSCPTWSRPRTQTASSPCADMDVLLDSVVRELVRLQMQVTMLQEIMQETRSEVGRGTVPSVAAQRRSARR